MARTDGHVSPTGGSWMDPPSSISIWVVQRSCGDPFREENNPRKGNICSKHPECDQRVPGGNARDKQSCRHSWEFGSKDATKGSGIAKTEPRGLAPSQGNFTPLPKIVKTGFPVGEGELMAEPRRGHSCQGFVCFLTGCKKDTTGQCSAKSPAHSCLCHAAGPRKAPPRPPVGLGCGGNPLYDEPQIILGERSGILPPGIPACPCASVSPRGE